MVYDLDKKRVLYFTGTGEAALTTIGYHDAFFRMISLVGLAFTVEGDGSFDVYIERVERDESVSQLAYKKVKVTGGDQGQLRYEWNFDDNIRTRVYRLRIENMDGVSIIQIDAKSALSEGPIVR